MECCRPAVSQHPSTACEGQKKRETTLCAEDPGAQRRGTGTLIKKRPSKTLEVAVGFKCPPLLRAKRALFVPPKSSSLHVQNKDGLAPDAHSSSQRWSFGFRPQHLGSTDSNATNCWANFDRRLAKHVFREDRVGGQSHVTVQQTSGCHSHRLVQQIVAQDALRQLHQKWHECSALRSRAAEFGLGGAVLLDHRHCEVAEAVRYLTLMVKTLDALPETAAPFSSVCSRHVGPLHDVKEDTAHEVRSHTLVRAMQPIDPETTGPQPKCSKNGADCVADTCDVG